MADSGSLFADQDTTIDDILQKNACGGPMAVKRYLDLRLQQLQRRVAAAQGKGSDFQEEAEVLEAFVEATEIFDQLSLAQPAQERS